MPTWIGKGISLRTNSPNGLHPNAIRHRPEIITPQLPSLGPRLFCCKNTDKKIDTTVGGANTKGTM